jgi:hypothetical protein
MTNKQFVLICGILITLALGFGAYHFLAWPHYSDVTLSKTFYLNQSYESVRKALVRTNATEKIVEANEAKILRQTIQGANFSADKIRNISSTWKVDADREIEIKVQELGCPMVFKQSAIIKPTDMVVTCRLVRPVEHLQDYKLVTKLEQYGNQTKVSISLYMMIKYRAPKLAIVKERIDTEVNEIAVKRLSMTQSAFEIVLPQYKDKGLFLRFKP